MSEPERTPRSLEDSPGRGPEALSLFKFRLLRYAPNRLSEEFFNIAVLLYDGRGRLVEARFTPDFVRLRCNPLADLRFLEALKADFENRRLLGENFSEFIAQVQQNLSQAVQITEGKSFLGSDSQESITRLVETYLMTLRRAESRESDPPPEGTRRWVQSRLHDTIRLYHLHERLDSAVAVGSFVSPRFSFQIDYAYKPNGETHYIHALSARHDLADAGRLCFVFDRIRALRPSQLTAIVGDALATDTRELLESSRIRPWAVSRLDDLALEIRDELRL